MNKNVVRLAATVFLAILIFVVPVHAQDTVFDKVSDWWATIGKEEPEKSLILAERRTERAAKRAGKAVREQAKQLDKSMKNIFGK